ncbi:unnamed protein product [Lasius platythorax]|uniref:Uncharacterized protein n=1 Tax=Lasius platythorax TaxID=488582 RepID=A0AAV2P1C1_9HYME
MIIAPERRRTLDDAGGRAGHAKLANERPKNFESGCGEDWGGSKGDRISHEYDSQSIFQPSIPNASLEME